MPHEKINYPRRRPLPAGVTVSVPSAVGLQATFDGGALDPQLVVEWNDIGWVQVALYPDGWRDTGDAARVDLNPQELALLIKVLKKAERKAYGRGQRHEGYEDFRGQEAITPRPLWDPRPAEDSGPVPGGMLDAEPFLSTLSPFRSKIPLPDDAEVAFEGSVGEEVDDIVSVGAGGYWSHDQSGEIRDLLFQVFGIESDGKDFRPDDAIVALVERHHFDIERASRLVYGWKNHPGGEI